MRTLNVYVTKNFLIILFVSIIVLTFGMMGVHLIKIFDLVSKGIPILDALSFLFNVMPLALSLTIPFGILVSVMLVFGRLSADNEVTAMRACGVSILQIIAPVILVTFLLTCLCLYLQLDLGPKFMGNAKDLVHKVGLSNPLAIFEPGRPVSQDNFTFFIDERIGENELRDIQVFVFDKGRQKVKHDITASSGRIDLDKEKKLLKIVLNDAIIVNRQYSKPEEEAAKEKAAKGDDEDNVLSKLSSGNDLVVYQEELVFPLDYGKEFSQMSIGKRPKYLPFRKLIGRISLYRRKGTDFFDMFGAQTSKEREITKLEIELNERLALALSPIAFLLLGLPLAIRTSRRETSVGLFLSVILAGVYFISVMICRSFDSHPEYHPEALLWIPNVLYQFIGTFFIYRIARK